MDGFCNIAEQMNGFSITSYGAQAFGNGAWTGYENGGSAQKAWGSQWGGWESEESDMSDDSGHWGSDGQQQTAHEETPVSSFIWSRPQTGWSPEPVAAFGGWTSPRADSAFFPKQNGSKKEVEEEVPKTKQELIARYQKLRGEMEKVELALRGYGVSKVDLMNMYQRQW